MIEDIVITDFEDKYQPGVDKLLDSIQDEYAENIYGPGVLKMKDAAKLPGRRYWVALRNGEVVGTVGLILLGNNNAVLKSMLLHKDYRGSDRMLAYRLMTTAMGHARNSGAATLYLGTMAQFEAAIAFYRKHRFTEIGESELPVDFVGNPVDVVFFKVDYNIRFRD